MKTRQFIDLSIRPQSLKDLKEMLEFASEKLEIFAVGIEYGDLCLKGREIAKEQGITLICRAVLRGETRRDVARSLSHYRGVKGVIKIAEVKTLDVARYVAVKRGIDVIRFEPEAFKFIDRSQAVLIRNGGYKPIEISLGSALLNEEALPKVLNAIRRAFSLSLDVILVSDARAVYEMIHPRSMAGVASLAGVPGDLALSFVSTTPRKVIERLLPRT